MPRRSIINHLSVGSTKDKLADMIMMYDAVAAALGATRQMAFTKDFADGKTAKAEDLLAAAYGRTAPELWVQLPHDEKEATAGNGTMGRTSLWIAKAELKSRLSTRLPWLMVPKTMDHQGPVQIQESITTLGILLIYVETKWKPSISPPKRKLKRWMVRKRKKRERGQQKFPVSNDWWV
ncbi:glyoxalase bleomycin resistance protein [Seminavis robusta]|uniref:Glyoxalase bleomycin resistance protein n=1 Tax=Seminavis robusta TaxID=568900 RepID=A0A9N8ECS7_9STRA|nr:glyoxalase bleomycin resistance protein [Seminavis robusta]|eukprot:Sro809_g205610.1 glyoxalase bleomycin resistance protein (179) ;mRNA; r:33517-34053